MPKAEIDFDQLKDHRKRFKKTERIKRQNEEWDRLEKEGKTVKAWHRKKRKVSDSKKPKPLLKKNKRTKKR